jgi:RHS repeat-associated protein
MPLRRGLQTCEVVSSPDTSTTTVYNEGFSGSSTGSFIPYPGTNVILSNVSQKLKIEAIWTSRPRATSPDFNVVSGKTYELSVDIDNISAGTGKTHNVRIRIYYPGGNVSQDFTSTGTATMTFTPTGTGTAKVEFLSLISPSTGGYSPGGYSPGNPYIIIDNLNVSYDSTFTSYDTVCSISSNKYRYGFNGMEKVNEIAGEGNSYDFGDRIYDGRLGRFFSRDPLIDKFPFYSPYQFSANQPISSKDIDGKECSNDANVIVYRISSVQFDESYTAQINRVLILMNSSSVFLSVQKSLEALKICEIDIVRQDPKKLRPSSNGNQNSGTGIIKMTIGSLKTDASIATTLMYETQNIVNHQAYIILNNLARGKKITKEEFVNGYFKLEALAALRTMEFQYEYPMFNDGSYSGMQKLFEEYKNGKLINPATNKNFTEDEFLEGLAEVLKESNPDIKARYESYFDDFSNENNNEKDDSNENNKSDQ